MKKKLTYSIFLFFDKILFKCNRIDCAVVLRVIYRKDAFIKLFRIDIV